MTTTTTQEAAIGITTEELTTATTTEESAITVTTEVPNTTQEPINSVPAGLRLLSKLLYYFFKNLKSTYLLSVLQGV